MPLLDRQRRDSLIGTIRVGTSTPGQKGRRPVRLDRFRFTSRSRPAIEMIAELYGGTARPWEDGAPTSGQFEVITHTAEILVAVPPGGMLTQDYELWVKGVRKRLCDSETERLKDPQPCVCAAERRRLCKPKSRLRVILADVPGGGTWGLSTVSGNAADELAGVAETLDRLALRGTVLPAALRLEQRVTFTDDERLDYPVVVLQLVQSMRELVALTAGEPGAVMLPPAPARLAAIEAARRTPPAGIPVSAPAAGPVQPATPPGGFERPNDATHLARMVEASPLNMAWIDDMRERARLAGWLEEWVDTRFSDAMSRLREVFDWRTAEIRGEGL